MNKAGQHNGAVHSPPGAPDCRAAVCADNLCFAYTNGQKALKGISFSLEAGDFMAVIGPNGGGKTTLLRLILGLLQPQAGSLAVFGRRPSDMYRAIGYVPQFATMRPDFPASVLEMTLMGAARPGGRAGSWPTHRAARQKAADYLDVLGLGGCLNASAGSLSGGQRQRALVARALMSRPEDGSPFLLLLDEPTASIDPEGKFCFYEFLGKLRGSVSMIVVSHDLFMVSPFFSRTVFINQSLTPLSGAGLTPENLNTLFGSHLHNCPVGDMQHAHASWTGGAQHGPDCSHPACQSGGNAHAAAPRPEHDCGSCDAANAAACACEPGTQPGKRESA